MGGFFGESESPKSKQDSKAKASSVPIYLSRPVNSLDATMYANYRNQLKEDTCAYSSCQKSPPRLLTCSRCKCSAYCDVDCQRNEWPVHKKVCKQHKQILEFMLQDAARTDATGKFILATRLALDREGDPRMSRKRWNSTKRPWNPILRLLVAIL